MRSTMSASRARLNFSQQQKALHRKSSLCIIKNKVYCLLFTVISTIIILFVIVYFDVASHSTAFPLNPQPSDNENIIIQNIDDDDKSEMLIPPDQKDHEVKAKSADLSSDDAYMSSLNIEDDNFLHLLHRRSSGFGSFDYDLMKSILSKYGSFANDIISKDISSSTLNGKYIVITPAAQMCNRMRAFMGTIFLGIMTRRVVFIDIGAEGYAARLNKIFKSPGYEWEFRSLPNKLQTLINNAPSKHFTFPYEHLNDNRPPSNVIHNQVCNDWTNDDKKVWKVSSHAAYLPVMARNKVLYKGVMLCLLLSVFFTYLLVFLAVLHQYESNADKKSHFDYAFAKHFIGRIGENGQEYIENLEVLLGRILFSLEANLQSEVDKIIKETYTMSDEYYKSKGIERSDLNAPLPVIGIHIRSEYVLLMNPKDCIGGKIEKCDKPYRWFADCGALALGMDEMLNGIDPFLFIAADTKEAQSAALSIFGAERVHFRPFGLTGGSFEGIQEAIIDLVTVSSFDAFVGTPHSSYSEMASILGQPRRSFDGEFVWQMNEEYQEKMPLNRMIIPIMTNVGWEIDKLNKYTFGGMIDVYLDNTDEIKNKILLPHTSDLKIDYQQNRICKQSITAGMGWMNLFKMLKNIKCYDRQWHHPNPQGAWFPVADK